MKKTRYIWSNLHHKAYPNKEEVQRLIQLGKDCCKNKEELITPFKIDLNIKK